MTKQELLDKITNHYINSPDYNGLPSYGLGDYLSDDLCELITDGLVRILSESDDINPYINRENRFASVAKQVETIRGARMFVVYPTPAHLSSCHVSSEKPFSQMLMNGYEQFRILYFSVDVLDLYVNNPQYHIIDHGYRGCIAVSNETAEENDPLHSEYIQDFGIAYPRSDDKDSDRAIAVFLRDLAHLNYEAQCKWRGFMLPDQQKFVVNGGFVKNLLYGQWVETHWIFDALLDMIRYINELCKCIGIPPMFNKAYSREEHNLIGYRILLIPSKKNYYEFVSALEKIVIHNINYDTFQKEATGIKPVDRRRQDGTLKGSIDMLEEWFANNYYRNNQIGIEAFRNEVISVLRSIRKIRQVPAHELYCNTHDKQLYRQQNELIINTYNVLEFIGFAFAKHPLSKQYVSAHAFPNHSRIVVY